MPGSTSNPLLTAAKEAAWNGEHSQAIEICTQTLADPSLDPMQRIDLLDVRAESYIALGKMDMAWQDANEMHALSSIEELPELKAKAYNCLARIDIEKGLFDKAIEAAAAALNAARTANNVQLEANCLLTLAEAHLKAHNLDPVFEAGNQAVALFRQLGDLSGEGRTYTWLSWANEHKADYPSMLRMAEKAVQLCREAGDHIGLGTALNALHYPQTGISEKLNILNEALRAFQHAGYLRGQGMILGIISEKYFDMGLFKQALRLTLQGQVIARQVGALDELGWSLTDVARYEIALGNRETAEAALDELIQVAAILDAAHWRKAVECIHDDLARMENDLPPSLVHLKYRMFDHIHSDIGTLDYRADFYLVMGDAPAALEASSKAIKLLGNDDIGDFNFQSIWWHYRQALSANGQVKAADEAQQKAYHHLITAIARIRDVGLRRNYLNKHAVHREIIAAWIEQGNQNDLKQERLYAHLAVEADSREPFHRLVETGLRLNELHSEPELLEFLLEEAVELSGAERLLIVLESDGRWELVRWQMPQDGDPQPLLLNIGERLDEAQHSRTVQLETADSPNSPTPSRITAPLIAQNRVLGALYADMDARYGSFEQADADMLGMLASQAAVALENVRLVEGLEEQVAERTAELQEANKEAEEARHIAEDANRAKSTFLANMSHELRTPLNAIIGFTRIVKRKAKRTDLPEKQIDNLGKVQSSAEHLLGLINSILDIAKIEAGGMDVHAAEFEIAPLIEMCLATAQPLAKPGVEMRAEIAPELPLVYSDQDKIKQILLNLLSNAAKFTHQGEIVAEVSIPRSSPSPPATRHSQLLIQVRDTGIGMNEEQVGRVFEEFQQADATTTRKYGGTGLGLPISKQLAQLLGGDLSASSVEGQGSTFRLVLPLRYEE